MSPLDALLGGRWFDEDGTLAVTSARGTPHPHGTTASRGAAPWIDMKGRGHDGLCRREQEERMAIKVIVELKALPGRRDALRSLIQELATRDRPDGYHGSTYYASLDDPDLLIDIAEWASPEARTAHLAKAMAAGAYGPVLELLAGPFRATVIRPLP